MKRIYDLVINLVSDLLPTGSKFNKSVSSFIQGRKNQTYPAHLERPIWIHCASLGEFEQGRSVIEAIKKEWPAQAVVLTFFSKSGYEIRKSYPLADWIGYMPLDTESNAQEFIQAIQPSLAIFVKYEFWINHLKQLTHQQIPFIFISTHFFKDHYLLKSWNRWLLREVLNAYAFFVQDDSSKKILQSLGYEQVIVTGDTRIDRVIEITKTIHSVEYFDKLSRQRHLFIAGSTWPADELILKDFFKSIKTYQVIIVPHDPSESRVQGLLNLFEEYHPVLYSAWKGESISMMIVDTIGILNRFYGYAQVAYIGGGFGKGIHNILEPAVYGIPVFFGPRYASFKEAEDLVAKGVAFSIRSTSELKVAWKENIPMNLDSIKSKSAQYFADNKGATAKIIDYLRPLIEKNISNRSFEVSG